MKFKLIKKALPLFLFSPILLTTFSCGDKNSNVEIQKGRLILNFDSEQGSVDVEGLGLNDTLILNNVVTFKVTPKENYKLKRLTVNNIDLTKELSFEVLDVSIDYEVCVTFEKIEDSNTDDTQKPDVPEINPDKPSEDLAVKYDCISVKKACEIAEAAGENLTAEEYYVYGVIKKIDNEIYGNMIIEYANSTIYAYGPTNWKSMSNKPAVGDEIVLKGKLQKYQNRNLQLLNPSIVEFKSENSTPDVPDVSIEKPTEPLALKYDCISVGKACEIAKEAGSNLTSVVYPVYGTVKQIENDVYGNMFIEYKGSIIYAYSPTNWKKLTNKPAVGDEIVLKGKLQNYNNNNLQLFNPEIVEFKNETTNPDDSDNDLATKYDCITLAKANEICSQTGNTETAETYNVYGVIQRVANVMNGSMTIVQGSDSLYIYAPINWNTYQQKPAAGDEIVFSGKLLLYEGKAELKKPTILEVVKHSVPEPEEKPDYEDGKTEVVDNVTYTYRHKIQVEKIYDPKYLGGNYSYSSTDKDSFYNSSFLRAENYNDAIARSNAFLLSGDYQIPGNIANYNNVKNPKSSNGDVFYNARARYIFDNPNYTGEPIGYIINDTDGDDSNDDVIFKGGAYISMDDVSAYLFAFNSAPANWASGKGSSDKRHISQLWGQYGRVNDAYFSGDTSRYPYEPTLTGNGTKFKYYETDFGTDGNFNFYTQNNSNTMSPQKPYYDNEIIRGTCRFVYTRSGISNNKIGLDGERHIFYTWSHYNDFEEYLNYKGGYGEVFGNLAAGNKYNSNSPQNPVTQPGNYILASFSK